MLRTLAFALAQATDGATSNANPSANPVTSASAAPTSLSLRQIVNDVSQGNYGSLADLAQQYLVPAFAALAGLLVGYLVAKYLSRLARGAICRRVDETFGRFAGQGVFWVVLLAIMLSILRTVGVDVTSFAAILATAGLAIGLAFQGTLSNFASGLLLMVFRWFKVGDDVVVAGMTGRVNEIDLFTTTLDTPDNRRIIIPNSSIVGTVIENNTHHPDRRMEITIGVSYSADTETTRSALAEALTSIDAVRLRGEGREPQIFLTNYAASSVDWTIRVWVRVVDRFAAREQLLVAVKAQLDAAQIEIPFPQMDLNVRNTAVAAAIGYDSSTRTDAMPSRPLNSIVPAEANLVRPRPRQQAA
jgi:small conductance mechanosensitive channel